MLKVVNMIPRALSDESEQDSEPSIAVNPQDPRQIIGSAFTPDPLGGPRAPIYVSADGGLSWSLHSIVPGGPVTHDISVAFAGRGGTLYVGTLNGSSDHLNILRAGSVLSASAMQLLVDRKKDDQPWVTAATAGGGAGSDRVYIGHNDLSGGERTASVEISQSARTAAAPAGFATHVVEQRPTLGQDGPPIRTAVHSDGTVYAAFQRWVTLIHESSTSLDLRADMVVLRDDAWASGAHPFNALTDPGDGTAGMRVARSRFIRSTGSVGPLGQERIGGDLALAVDPADSANVWVAWCDRVGGPTGTDWTLHVRRSRDRGQTWSSSDAKTVKNAKNPALAVNAHGLLGLMYQQLELPPPGSRWVTRLDLTTDSWATPAQVFVLHSALASAPHRQFFPYLGDYIRLLTVGNDFYGVFSGANRPDHANFPNGVTYQRNANWTTRALLGSDGASGVPESIDPFFVHYTPGV